MTYVCPICGGRLKDESDVRVHAEKRGERAYRKRPSFAPRSVFVEWYFAYIWLNKKPAK